MHSHREPSAKKGLGFEQTSTHHFPLLPSQHCASSLKANRTAYLQKILWRIVPMWMSLQIGLIDASQSCDVNIALSIIKPGFTMRMTTPCCITLAFCSAYVPKIAFRMKACKVSFPSIVRWCRFEQLSPNSGGNEILVRSLLKSDVLF